MVREVWRNLLHYPFFCKMDVKYFRYMDDIVILAPSWRKLKSATRVLNETLNGLKVEKHSHKTSTVRIEKGFDFLGYPFGPNGLSFAQMTSDNFFEKVSGF